MRGRVVIDLCQEEDVPEVVNRRPREGRRRRNVGDVTTAMDLSTEAFLPTGSSSRSRYRGRNRRTVPQDEDTDAATTASQRMRPEIVFTLPPSPPAIQHSHNHNVTDHAHSSHWSSTTSASVSQCSLHQILDMFPDADEKYVQSQIQANNNRSIDEVINDMITSSYPKRKINEDKDAVVLSSTRKRRKERPLEREDRKPSAQNCQLDCSCCYVPVEITTMIPCRDGHLFCITCVTQYAQNQIYGQASLGTCPVRKQPNTELQCFHPEEQCMAGFSDTVLGKVLSKDAWKAYDQLRTDIALRMTNLEQETVTCPQCNIKTILLPTQRVLLCPSCAFQSCRECGKESHIPYRCGEKEVDEAKTKGRITVEEAITNAKIRHCPSCKKPIVKADGCNKMKCACGTLFCYICRKSVKGYDHFCNTPHCTHKKCKKCVLFTKTEEDDALAMREAGLNAASQVQESLRNKPGLGDEDVGIDVDAILKAPARGRGHK